MSAPRRAALGLDNNFPAWRRGLIAALIGVVILIWQRKLAVAWAIVGACAAFGVIFAATGLGENPSTPAVVSVFIVVLFGSYGLKGALQGTLQGTHGATAFFLVFTQVVLWTFSGHPPIMPRIGAQACAVVFAIVSVVGVAVLAIIALIYRWQGVFFSLFLPAMILVCVVAADLLSHKETWGDFGPLLLFLGLLTLLNAPFDWASLDLTRALLILNWIPEGKAVPEYRRQSAAIGLTAQMFAGAGLGIAAQAFLAWSLIFQVMPWVGLDLLDMARAVAAFDLPRRVAQLFAVYSALK
jgi:hypothetical protein